MVTVAYIPGFGSPSVPEVAEYFNQLGHSLSVRTLGYDEATFSRRGLIRNDMVRLSVGRRILFTDADMVLPPGWCDTALDPDLDASECLHTARTSTNLAETESMLALESYPGVIDYPFQRSMELAERVMPDIGAGYCQLIDGDTIRRRGCYVTTVRDRPWSLERSATYLSDRDFRNSIGHRQEPRLPMLCHLQHERDKGGGHLRTQR